MRSILFGLYAGTAVAIVSVITNSMVDQMPFGTISAIISLMVGLSVLHYWKTAHFKAMDDGIQQLTNKLAQLHDHVSETQGLVQLSRFNDTYPLPFGGGWALTADAAVVLVREIAINRPRNILELGSGVSTQLIARMLKEAGEGMLYSMDHDVKWASQTRRHIRASGLENHVVVLDAPLEKQRFNDQEFNWYSIPEVLRKVDDIDMIIVDGPPQSLDPDGMPRYPALPAFIGQLSPNAMIYIDDAKRPYEQRMIARWLKEFPEFESRIYETVPGTCLLIRNG
jgi:predicted O-methyltransferase YrrM